jgi:Flp pilus assembly pilin Flp
MKNVAIWMKVRQDIALHRAMSHLDRLRRDRTGVTAMEYGIIAAITVGAIGAVMALIGPQLTGIFTKIQTLLTAANAAA